tara:strand:+ start:424 stop:837 length:414 start_codon:yes stop_codon:yes gene_type:complete
MLRNAVTPRQKARQNMLYFSDGTAGANATGEAVCIPSYCIKSMEPISASLMNIYFQELREEQGTTTAVDSTPKYSYVSLSIGDGDFKEVCHTIVGAINDQRSDGFVVVCDALNGKFISGKITDCTINFVDGNTDPTD